MKKIIHFIELFGGAIGFVGGIAAAIAAGAWPLSVGIVLLGVMALPRAKEIWNELLLKSEN